MYDDTYDKRVIEAVGMTRQKLGLADLDYNAKLTLIMSREFYRNLMINTRDYVPNAMNKNNKIYGCEIIIDYAAEVDFRVLMDF